MKFKTFVIAVLALSTLHVSAQNNKQNEKALEYIEKYKDLAIREQIRTGVPASIKLAQGIYETGAGTSELSQNANNHFGIKCKSTWQGDTYTYTDDRPNECFRKYDNDSSSYLDHSDFLKTNQRYKTLFTYQVTDYKSWAHGLKKAGYATNPLYASKIIETIDKYDLHSYTLIAMQTNNNTEVLYASTAPMIVNTSKETETNATLTTSNPKSNVSQQITVTQKPKEYYITQELNGLKGFYAPQGEMLLDYAIKNKIRYSKILEINELPDQPLEADMFIYLTKKNKRALIETHTVQDGETLVQVSQATGMQLSEIKLLNKLVDGVEPKAGSILYLQTETTQVPEVYIPQPKSNAKPKVARVNNTTDYVVVTKTPNAPKEEVFTFNKDKKQDEPTKPTTPVDYRISTTKPTNQATTAATEKAVAANTSTTTKPVENKGNLSPYEKLKQHMDNKMQNDGSTSYNEQQQETLEDYTITPAAKRAPAQTAAPAATAKTTPVKKPAAAKSKTYTVRKGDTLAAIAKKNGVTVKQLQTWNKVNPKSIQPGQKLKVSK